MILFEWGWDGYHKHICFFRSCNRLKKFILQSFIILLLSTNCVEHKISISVNPNGSYGYTHHVEGDKKDIMDYESPEESSSITESLKMLIDKFFVTESLSMTNTPVIYDKI